MEPEDRGPIAPHPVVASVTAALNREYRVPFVTIVVVVAVVGLSMMSFLYAYGHVVAWVRDQVRAERTVVDVQRDLDKIAQDKEIAGHEGRIVQLERRMNEGDTSLAALTVQVRGMREDVTTLSKTVREEMSRRAR